MKNVKTFIELRFFGVCTYLGDKLGIPSATIRMFFIYSSFLAFGSPVLIYLALAFLIRVRNVFRKKRRPIWDY